MTPSDDPNPYKLIKERDLSNLQEEAEVGGNMGLEPAYEMF